MVGAQGCQHFGKIVGGVIEVQGGQVSGNCQVNGFCLQMSGKCQVNGFCLQMSGKCQVEKIGMSGK